MNRLISEPSCNIINVICVCASMYIYVYALLYSNNQHFLAFRTGLWYKISLLWVFSFVCFYSCKGYLCWTHFDLHWMYLEFSHNSNCNRLGHSCSGSPKIVSLPSVKHGMGAVGEDQYFQMQIHPVSWIKTCRPHDNTLAININFWQCQPAIHGAGW